jgi:cytochrome c oxidase subunit 3
VFLGADRNKTAFGLSTLDEIGIPLLNTIILLSRGAFVTWSHHLLINGKGFKIPLIICLFLGGFFLLIQIFEFKTTMFSITDGCSTGSFFMLTGFHGFHVLLGCGLLRLCVFRRARILSHIGIETRI